MSDLWNDLVEAGWVGWVLMLAWLIGSVAVVIWMVRA